MKGQIQNVVGRNIRVWRRAQGLSQETFGEQVGWHRTFVGAVERGERNLTLQSVERIAEELGIHPLDLLWDQEAIVVTFDADGRGRFRPRAATLKAADSGGSASPGRAARRPRPT